MTTGLKHVSMGEIEFIVTRAAFGVGAPFGIAEDFAEATKTMARFGFDPTPSALNCLNYLDLKPESGKLSLANRNTKVIISGPGRLSAVYTGPSISDFGYRLRCHGTTIEALNVDYPILVAAAIVSNQITNCIIEWPNTQVILNEQRVIQINVADENQLQSPGPVNLSIRSCVTKTNNHEDKRHRFNVARIEPEAKRVDYEGVLVDTYAWAGLVELFNRCLVPSSDSSLLVGAGAGLVDRD